MRTMMLAAGAAALAMALAGCTPTADAAARPSATAAPANVPVGGAIAFFGTPAQVAKLGPGWLPADGRTVADKASPLNGLKLPDLRDRFPKGADPTLDVTAGSNLEGGSLDTSREVKCCKQGQVAENHHGFVEDTSADEIVSYEHSHTIDPPYRKLVFLVRVR